MRKRVARASWTYPARRSPPLCSPPSRYGLPPSISLFLMRVRLFVSPGDSLTISDSPVRKRFFPAFSFFSPAYPMRVLFLSGVAPQRLVDVPWFAARPAFSVLAPNFFSRLFLPISHLKRPYPGSCSYVEAILPSIEVLSRLSLFSIHFSPYHSPLFFSWIFCSLRHWPCGSCSFCLLFFPPLCLRKAPSKGPGEGVCFFCRLPILCVPFPSPRNSPRVRFSQTFLDASTPYSGFFFQPQSLYVLEKSAQWGKSRSCPSSPPKFSLIFF